MAVVETDRITDTLRSADGTVVPADVAGDLTIELAEFARLQDMQTTGAYHSPTSDLTIFAGPCCV